jgi:outer membrane protein assembly factor BamB
VGSGRRRIALWAGSGVVLLALLTTALVVLVRDDAGMTEAWRVPDDDSLVVGDVDPGLWVHDAVVTRVAPASVTGYDASDGHRLWEAETPDGAGRACAASERTNAEGIGAVFFTSASEDGDGDGDGEECTVLGVIDTRDGTLLWSRQLTFPAYVAGEDVTATVGEETVIINDSSNAPDGFHRFDLATGDELPVPPGPDCPTGSTSTPITIGHAESRILVLSTCVEQATGTYGSWILGVYDAETWEFLWSRPANEATAPYAVSGEPLIVAEGSHWVAYSDTGERLWRLRITDEVTGVRRLDERSVVGEVLIAESLTEDGSGRGIFAGYDVNSGELLWRGTFPELTEVLGEDDDGAVLLGTYEYSDDGGQLHLSWLDPADGTARNAGTVPFPLQDGTIGMVAAFDADRLFLSGSVERELRLRAFER